MTDLPITYIPNFIANPDAMLLALQTKLDWERRDDAPRSEFYINDLNEPYTYGNGRGRRTYFPRTPCEEVLAIRKQLEEYVRCAQGPTSFAPIFPKPIKSVFEVCFLNRYLNQSDQLGWHSDSSPEMDDERPIATISFGVEREIWFRPNGKENLENITRLKLGNGSMCLMHPGMQDTHQHRIPKASFQCGERISLTFRGYVKVGL